MTDLEKFLDECEGWVDGCITPLPSDAYIKKLLAMVQLLKKSICLMDDCSKCGHYEQYLCEHYDTMQELNKIAKGESNGKD